MKRQKVHTVDAAWQWPLPRSRYDDSPTLIEEERQALAALAQHMAHDLWHRQLTALIPRLVTPLLDVFALVQLPRCLYRRALVPFIRAMHQEGTPFWAWSSDSWEAFLAAGNAEWRYSGVAVAYVLCDVTELRMLRHVTKFGAFAGKVFGPQLVASAQEEVVSAAHAWGYRFYVDAPLRALVAEALLLARAPYLTAITDEIIETLFQAPRSDEHRGAVEFLSRLLHSQGIVTKTISAILTKRPIPHPDVAEAQAALDQHLKGIAPEWIAWCQRWYHRSTLSEGVRRHMYLSLLRAGRWLALEHPTITSPAQWTTEIATAYVAAVDHCHVGEWSLSVQVRRFVTWGKPLQPRTKASCLAAMRAFFRDCQEWEWLPRRFDPGRCLRTPRTVRNLIGPNPRVIDTAMWPKIVDAALRLEDADLPHLRGNALQYPLEMVRALAAVWCGAALRSSDITRLRVGCIRWQREDVQVPGSEDVLPKEVVCFLEVPTNKTSTTYVKPVSPLVGQRIAEWEQVRPPQVPALDKKTGELVSFLFSFRGVRLSKGYLNTTLIPLLCRRAGLPEADARGPITSHRARATLATLLFNAKHPLTLFELQAFLGHRSLTSTQHYAQVTPTKLAKAVVDAGIHETLTYAAKVLLDQEAILDGSAAAGQPWKYYDLGHGYCTSAFFTTCPHRMACARCDWYLPKDSSFAQYLESKTNIARMKEEIPLTEEERAIIDGDLSALETLCTRLVDVPTLAGATPRELATKPRRSLPVLRASSS